MSDSSVTREAPAGPARPQLQDHGDVVGWQPPMSHFNVLGPVGVVEHHSGVGLTLKAVVRHLCRNDWPRTFDGTDLIVYDGTRAVVRVVYAWHGRPDHGYPYAYWLWDRVGDHSAGDAFLYCDDEDDDGQGDD